MVDLASAFAQIAGAVSAAVGGPYHDARVISQADVAEDDGGSIVAAGDPAERACSAQVDSATDQMRREAGFVEEDRRILVLAASIEGEITTSDTIELIAGPFAGEWSIQRVARDPAALGFELRARPV